ncbi:MAG TPA: hypothetical protein VM261_02270 [Kofleriaceae bacterium]|nr:hypothetical protein [Kofleriaceae bacterium]
MKLVISMSIVAGLGAVAAAQPAKPAPPPPPAEKKAPPPAKPTPPPAPPVTQPAPPAAPAMPAPSAEVAAVVKANTGTWKCTGKAMMPDGTAMDMKATMKAKFALDKFWAQMSFAETKKNGYKFESYRTFDGKKWHDITVDNMGGHSVSTSDGPKDGKTTWTGVSRDPMMGEHAVKHHEEAVGTTGKEMKVWGEYSMDKGKTWTKGYEAACKK